MKFWKITDETVCELMREFHSHYDSAFDDALKFSRKVGGDKRKIALSDGIGGIRIAIIFKEEPDRNIWKMCNRDSPTEWVPKRSKIAKETRNEFDAIEDSFPSRWDFYKALNYEPFNNGFGRFQEYRGTWIFATGDKFKPSKKQQCKMERISDVEYEAMLG
jgi:hypothetical protein